MRWGWILQEIKFEPTVMCEHIDKKSTFRGSQVCKPRTHGNQVVLKRDSTLSICSTVDTSMRVILRYIVWDEYLIV